MGYTVYSADGTVRTQWASKSSALAAARALKIPGSYVVNERNAEIIWRAR